MANERSAPTTVRTVERVADLFTAFAESDAATLGVTELAQLLGLSKPVVHRMLVSLRAKDFVEIDERTRRYSLGPAAIAVGLRYLQGIDIREKARGILKITIGDGFHLERNFHVTVDWGDGIIENYTIPGNPRASRGFILGNGTRNNLMPDATITASLDSGVLLPDGTRMPGIYFIHHTYLQPPDLSDPAAPIPVKAEIRYDARPEGETSLDLIPPADGSNIFNGIRFFENLTQEIFSTDNDVMTNPGQGAFAFIKVVESEIIPVELRKVTTAVVSNTTVVGTSSFGERLDFVTSQFEAQTFGGFRLYFRVVDDATGIEFGDFTLPNEAIADPLSAMTGDVRFPNGHYRIYLEDLRTKRSRMIREVHIYEGRVVPPNFRQGATERQPGSDAVETNDNPAEPNPAQPNPEEGAANPPRAAATTATGITLPDDVTADSAAGTSESQPTGTASATMAGAAAWLMLPPRLRRRLKRADATQPRLDKPARRLRQLRDKFTS